MIFGKTYVERHEEINEPIKDMFALFPIHLDDGRRAWLQNVYYYDKTYFCYDGYVTEYFYFETREEAEKRYNALNEFEKRNMHLP